jgi:hypothetical protein
VVRFCAKPVSAKNNAASMIDEIGVNLFSIFRKIDSLAAEVLSTHPHRRSHGKNKARPERTGFCLD